jgi:2-desacetyl-2-hydroxyethyl bacteriochlorophyllide A dehydrogenase
MRSIICERPELLSFQSKPEPLMENGNVLLRVKRVGICGTDLHAFKGNQPFFTYPRILGHELATEVMAFDGSNHELNVGDKVVVIPYLHCGHCVACLAGKTNCCQHLKVFGVHTDGGMQDIISLPPHLLIPANDLSFDEIAIVEPLSIGAHALRRAGVKNDDLVVVLGCGPIGMGIIQLAKSLGATVVAVDINEGRLQMAQQHFGADAVIPANADAIENVKKFSGGDLGHIVIDATGSKRAIETAADYMRHGGTLVLVGLFRGELTFQHPALHAKETTFMCSRNATRQDFDFVLNVLREKKFNTEAYITRRASCGDILTELSKWASPTSPEIKVMTDWDAPV